jgi:glycosyltransferase involved in cell wall biosynthesis
VIVVDSASDATYDVTRRYIGQRDGFQIIQNQQNYGAGPSRNIGVRHSQGDLIFFLDGDDIYFEEHIYLCVNQMMKHPQIHFAHTLIRIDEDIHPQWQQSIEDSVPINLCVRRWCHDLVGGYFEDDAFKVCRCEDALYRDLLGKFFSGLTIKKETVQHFRYPGNALDRQMPKFCLPPEAGVDSLTEPQRAVMPAIQKIHADRADQIRKVLTHWVNFLGKSAAI